MANNEALRDAIRDLAPKGLRGPHSQFVKGYNRAIRDVLAALDRIEATPTTTPQGGESDVQEVKEEEGILSPAGPSGRPE